ncbi:MAG: RNA polymerase sigma factor [Opitutaceae bacterium]|nr:RNA polymerase sigma factor [Opitutaceae bacterium]
MQLTHSAPAMNDEQLITRHLKGDASAFREIVERHQAMVCTVAFSACGDVTRSDDVAQETFVAAWKQMPQLRERSKFRAWLGGIARNLGNNHRRQAARAGLLPVVRRAARA